jgi:heme oxygenase (biliverdin-IX-beta and delta-forming)
MGNTAFEPGLPSVLEALRSATRPRHAKLASSPAMVRLFDPDYTIPEYRAHLGRLLGLFEPLEYLVAQIADPADPACALQRSSDLREDLRLTGALTTEVDAFERYRRLPSIPRAGLRGYTYVILGSLLGGRIIVRQLRAVLGPGASFRFYGDESGHYDALWASLCSDLEENGRSDVQTICATAAGIFDAYAEWFSEPLLREGRF